MCFQKYEPIDLGEGLIGSFGPTCKVLGMVEMQCTMSERKESYFCRLLIKHYLVVHCNGTGTMVVKISVEKTNPIRPGSSFKKNIVIFGSIQNRNFRVLCSKDVLLLIWKVFTCLSHTAKPAYSNTCNSIPRHGSDHGCCQQYRILDSNVDNNHS